MERYPREVNIQIETNSIDTIDDEFIKNIDAFINDQNSAVNTKAVNQEYYKIIATAGRVEKGVIELDPVNRADSIEEIYQIYIVTLEDYNRIMAKSETLNETDALLYCTRGGLQKIR